MVVFVIVLIKQMVVNVKIVKENLSIFLFIYIILFFLVDCAQPDDDDADTCIPENQSLCIQSDIFAYKCLHLCGKC